MCGICGKLNFDRQEPVEPQLLHRMMDMIQHRGPDGGGEYRSGPVGLGHRRLSIIDLSTGDQPMCNEDGTVWVVYNGEIYNFLELRADLLARGHKFKSRTDTEVIIHLYEQLGLDAVSHFRGMFAFALWDQRKQLLLLARDRVGIKPVYYINTGKALVFGSEIKSLLADPFVERRVNPRAVDRFLTYYYLPGNETMFEGVFKLEPGHFLVALDGQIKKQQYWDLVFPREMSKKNFYNSVQDLRSLLSRTVKDHMISDVPVGVLLSGGVDSTGVLRYAVEERDQPIHSFTIGFEGQDFDDERPYARLAANTYGTIHREITITATDFENFLPKYVWHMEEPVCEPPAVALYYVAQLARQTGVKVLLSGEGGDEAFGGYQNYRNLFFLERLKNAFGSKISILRFLLEALGRVCRKRVSLYTKLVDRPISEYYLSRTATPGTLFNQNKGALYSIELIEELGSVEPDLPTQRLFERLTGVSTLNQMLYVDTKTWLPDDLLIKADKITMATSVELRVPLLDFQILEFAASLPQDFKVKSWTTKRILKAALDDSVPEEILNRKKTGFPVPYSSWLRGDMKELLFDTVMGESSMISSYFNMTKVDEILQAHQWGGVYSKEVFSLLVLELWHQAFISK